MFRKLIQLSVLSILFLIVISAVFALTASNTVSESGADDESHAITANQIKPSACNSLNLGTVVTDGNGSTGNDLILGSSSADILNGNDGDDCIVAGDNDDTLDGGAGTDICIGGVGTDTFLNCETQIDT